jgi:hypothetical protein
LKTLRPQHVVGLLLMLAVLSPTGGCATSDSQRLYIAKQTLKSGENSLAVAYDADLLSPPAFIAVDAARDRARAAVAKADAKFRAGEKLNFEFAMQELGLALDDFMRLADQFKAKGSGQ